MNNNPQGFNRPPQQGYQQKQQGFGVPMQQGGPMQHVHPQHGGQHMINIGIPGMEHLNAIGEAHDNRQFAHLFKEEYSEAERNKCYEGTIECCGNAEGFCKSFICCCLDRPYKEVQESQFGVVQSFGKFKDVKGPGLHYLNPQCETIAFVDKKESFIDLKSQSIMTKDNVNITIDAVVYYQIEDPYKALFKVQNVILSIAEIAKTTLRDIFGHVTLQEALETKEKMAVLIRELIDKPTNDWGVNINRVLIQEILFSKDLQDNLAAAATAKRMAEGKIIQAQADVDSAKLLREASDILNTHAAMQIRYLDAITGLARANNTKIIFMPSDAAKGK